MFSFPHSPVTSPCLSKHQGRTSISRFSWWTTSTALGSGASTPWTSWWSTIRKPPSSPASTGRSSTSSGRCSDAPGRRPGWAVLQAPFSPPGPFFVQVGYLPPPHSLPSRALPAGFRDERWTERVGSLYSSSVGERPGERKARAELWVQGAAPRSLCLMSSPGIGARNVQKLYLVGQKH